MPTARVVTVRLDAFERALLDLACVGGETMSSVMRTGLRDLMALTQPAAYAELRKRHVK